MLPSGFTLAVPLNLALISPLGPNAVAFELKLPGVGYLFSFRVAPYSRLPHSLPSIEPTSVSAPLAGGAPLLTLTWANLPVTLTLHLWTLRPCAAPARVGPTTASVSAAATAPSTTFRITPPRWGSRPYTGAVAWSAMKSRTG